MPAWYEFDGSIRPVPRPRPLAETIRGELLNALAYTEGRQDEAAALLGLSPRALGYQLVIHGIPTAYGAAKQPKRKRTLPNRRKQ